MAAASEEHLKQLAMEEVKQHNKRSSNWIVVHDRVYDVTPFLNEHPGGEEVLLEQGGKIATDAFEDVGHSRDARQLMNKYLIGELNDADKREKQKKSAGEKTETTQSSGEGNTYTLLLIALFVAGAAVFAYFKMVGGN